MLTSLRWYLLPGSPIFLQWRPVCPFLLGLLPLPEAPPLPEAALLPQTKQKLLPHLRHLQINSNTTNSSKPTNSNAENTTNSSKPTYSDAATQIYESKLPEDESDNGDAAECAEFIEPSANISPLLLLNSITFAESQSGILSSSTLIRKKHLPNLDKLRGCCQTSLSYLKILKT